MNTKCWVSPFSFNCVCHGVYIPECETCSPLRRQIRPALPQAWYCKRKTLVRNDGEGRISQTVWVSRQKLSRNLTDVDRCVCICGDQDLVMLTHRRGHVLSLSALTLFAFCAVLPKRIMTFFGHIMIYSVCHNIPPSTLFISACIWSVIRYFLYSSHGGMNILAAQWISSVCGLNNSSGWTQISETE